MCKKVHEAQLQEGSFHIGMESAKGRKLLFHLAGRHTLPLLQRTANPFSISKMDVFPRHFSATVLAVLRSTSSGVLRDVLLRMFRLFALMVSHWKQGQFSYVTFYDNILVELCHFAQNLTHLVETSSGDQAICSMAAGDYVVLLPIVRQERWQANSSIEK